MEPGKRSKNYTEKEKMLLIEIATEYLAIIDNKKTDGTSVEAKKQAWMALTNKYNAACETGFRTEKQLHALYDNIKKKARKNISDDKLEMYKTGGGTFSPKTTIMDEKIVALLTPQFTPLLNEFDSSASYYNGSIRKDIRDEINFDNIQRLNNDTPGGPDCVIVLEANKALVSEPPIPPKEGETSRKISVSPHVKDKCTPKLNLTETKRKNIDSIGASFIQRKKKKQENEDAITQKKLEILEIQRQAEDIKAKKTETLLDLEIELKKVLLENAKRELNKTI